MIEEAAGTRMYECKKISAQKTIEKKEAKLKEIQTVQPPAKTDSLAPTTQSAVSCLSDGVSSTCVFRSWMRRSHRPCRN